MKILFVCIGNICRSPLLHHLLRKKLDADGFKTEIVVDSCGISGWNVGEEMDERMREAALSRGISLDPHKAKTFHPSMYKEYDFIFVVTKEILDHLRHSVKGEERKKLILATHYSPSFKDRDIPDPYCGSTPHFNEVYDMIDTVLNETLLALKNDNKY